MEPECTCGRGYDPECPANHNSPDDPVAEFYACPKCGSDDCTRETSWQCHGEGGFHDCGEDCCCCLDKDEITDECEECGGEGSYWICHTCIDAKMSEEATGK